MMAQRQQHKTPCKDNQSQKDIISDIPDCLLIHILSLVSTKQAVQTCILSKRWINLWKALPTLITCELDFISKKKKNNKSLEQFVVQFLSLRDHSAPIRTIFTEGFPYMNSSLIQRLMEYASSHGVQHLQIKIDNINHLFSSHTLTYLSLSGRWINYAQKLIFPNSLNLPALTTLYLKYFSFPCLSGDGGCVIDPFSTFSKLNTLVIDGCLLVDNTHNLRISSTNLVSLTIWMCDQVFIPNDFERTSFGIELYTPALHTFAFTGNQNVPELFGSKSVFSSIKNVSIYASGYRWSNDNPSTLHKWLVELPNIESLTVSNNTLKVLSGFYDLSKVKLKLPSLYNLKSLKINTYFPSCIPPGTVDFLLQNSPSAKVYTISSIGQRPTV